MFEIKAKDVPAYDAFMERYPHRMDRLTSDVFALLGVTSMMVTLEVARNRGGPWWLLLLQVVIGVLVVGHLITRYNNTRMPESELPNGNRKIHWNWPIFFKGLALSLLCYGAAWLLAKEIPQVLAADQLADCTQKTVSR